MELTAYLCWTELFEIELNICIKMDLALNNLQKLKCHETELTYRALWLDSPCGVMDNVLDWNIETDRRHIIFFFF